MSPPDPGDAALLDALRPALEAALDHGRTLAADGEVTAVPGRIAKLLSHTRATAQGLRVVRSVLDSDEAFRAAVAASSTRSRIFVRTKSAAWSLASRLIS